jgi:hypothetical protein
MGTHGDDDILGGRTPPSVHVPPSSARSWLIAAAAVLAYLAWAGARELWPVLVRWREARQRKSVLAVRIQRTRG